MDTSNSHTVTRTLVLRITSAFAITGLLTGAVCSAFLYFFAGEEYYPVVFGFHGLWHFFALPIVAAGIAAFYACILATIQRVVPVGIIFGVIVAILSFVTNALLLSFYVAGRELLDVFFGFVLFGGLFLGWLLVGAGAIAGFITARRLRSTD